MVIGDCASHMPRAEHALCWTQGGRDGKRSPSHWCLLDAPWHLVETGSASRPRVTTCDSHWVSRHVSAGWRAEPPGAIPHEALCPEALILCIWLPCLAVLNGLVDGVGAGLANRSRLCTYI